MREKAIGVLQTIRQQTRGSAPKESREPQGLDLTGASVQALPEDGSAVQQEDGSYSGVINRDAQQLPANVNPAPAEAINYLKQNPGMAAEFRAKYNYLPEGF
jgi:hypothetical protein